MTKVNEVLKDKKIVKILLQNVETRFHHKHYHYLLVRGEPVLTSPVLRRYESSRNDPNPTPRITEDNRTFLEELELKLFSVLESEAPRTHQPVNK